MVVVVSQKDLQQSPAVSVDDTLRQCRPSASFDDQQPGGASNDARRLLARYRSQR
jgi:hypothetical protein